MTVNLTATSAMPNSAAVETAGGLMSPIWVGWLKQVSDLASSNVPVYDVTRYGADPRGVASSTTAIQTAINAAQAAGGGIVYIPRGTYLITTSALTITTGNITLTGDSTYGTVLNINNGTNDGIKVGFQGSAVQGVTVQNMSLVGVSRGSTVNGVNAYNIANTAFRGLSLRSMSNGIAVGKLNNVLIDWTEIICSAAGTAGILWTSPANNTDRSDVLTITDTVVNANGNGQTGLYIDGMCQTLRVARLGLIHCSYGLRVRNTAASNTFFPTFFYVDDIEIDGVDNNAISIEGGREMHFVHADCFNAGGNGADTDCVRILSDGSASVTSLITFTACRLAGARRHGVLCYGKMVDFSNCYVGDNAIAGAGTGSAWALENDGGTNGSAVGVNIVGCRTIAFGDLANQAYGVTVAAGCARVNIVGNDFSSCVTGAILDNTASPGNVCWHTNYDITGAPYPDRVQIVSADPASPYEGQLWENISTHHLKMYLNGVVTTIV